MNLFTEQNDTTCRAPPLLVHKVCMLAKNAGVPLGTRIITAGTLEVLRTAIRGAPDRAG